MDSQCKKGDFEAVVSLIDVMVWDSVMALVEAMPCNGPYIGGRVSELTPKLSVRSRACADQGLVVAHELANQGPPITNRCILANQHQPKTEPAASIVLPDPHLPTSSWTTKKAEAKRRSAELTDGDGRGGKSLGNPNVQQRQPNLDNTSLPAYAAQLHHARK